MPGHYRKSFKKKALSLYKKPAKSHNVDSKNVQKIVKSIVFKQSERKVYVYPLDVSLNNLAPGWNIFNIMQMIQGNAQDERVGDAITVTKIDTRLNLWARTTDALDPVTLRMFLLDDESVITTADMTGAITKSYARYDARHSGATVIWEKSGIAGNSEVSRLNGLEFYHSVDFKKHRKSHFEKGTQDVIRGFSPQIAMAGYQTFSSVVGPIMTTNHTIRIQGNIYIEYFDA